jgi:hypothetical protein
VGYVVADCVPQDWGLTALLIEGGEGDVSTATILTTSRVLCVSVRIWRF